MRKLNKLIVLLYFFVISLYAGVSVNLPCSDVSVQRGLTYTTFIGSRLYGAPGQPELPVYTCAILIPPDADLTTLSFSIKDLKESLHEGVFNVRPALPQANINGLCWPKDRNIVDGKDIDVYSKNQFLPQKYVEVLDKGRLHCFKMVSVRVYLSTYNPVTKKLLQMTKGKLVVDFKRESGYSQKRNASIKVPANIKNRLKATVVNYEEFIGNYEADFNFIRQGKYIVLTASSTQSSSQKLDAFVQSKQQRGFDVEVVTESTWGGGTGSTAANNMRGWLQDNYQEMGIEYVIIIGSSNASSSEVPMMMMQGNNNTEADFCYAQLTGQPKDDMECEVAVGRIPIYDNDINTVDNILDKCIVYESANPKDIAWRENALFGAGGYDSSTKGDKLFEAMHENFIVPTTPWQDYRIYGTDYGQPTGTPDKVGISSTIFTDQWKNNQYGLVEWGTHGSSTSASHVMSSSKTTEVGNDYPAYVLCGSCSNASVSSSSNLTYSILKNCGIGGIGGTHLTYYSPGQTNFEGSGSDQGWVYEFGNAMIVKQMTSGDALNYMRGLSNAWWSNNIPYVLYGDPSLGIYTCISELFVEVTSPNGGEEWEQGRSFDISWSTNIDDNVKVELLKGGSVEEVLAASVSPDGPYTWEVADDFPLGTDYKIRVTCVVQDTLTDESDDNFAIGEKSNLELTSLNSGEYIEKGSEVEITWEDNLSGNIQIDLFKEGTIYITIAESVPSNGSYTWKVSDDIISGSDYKVRITSVEKDWLYDESEENISIQNPMITEFPYVQDFDDFVVGGVALRGYWEQLDGEDLDWTVWTGKTPSKEDDQGAATGPDNDHTSGSGNYLYVESSSPNNPDKKADIITPMFDFHYVTSAELSFWYHMFSDNEGADEMGDLYLDINVDGTWQNDVVHLEKDHGDEWFEEKIDISDNAGKRIQFRFRAITGSGWASDVCIDDFKIEAATGITTTNKIVPSSFNLRAYNSRIYYQIPDNVDNKQHHVSLKLYNIQGKLVRTLVNGPAITGYHAVRLDKQGGRHELAAGLYLCRMETKGFNKTVKISLGK